jgi:hypothetical protein
MARHEVSKMARALVMDKAIGCMDSDKGYQTTRGNLIAAGFKYLGGGAFGSAWAHADIPGWCIKLSGGSDNYAAFVYWAMANPNPHLPEFQYPAFDRDRQQFMVMLQLMTDAYDFDDYYVARDICQSVARNNEFTKPETELQSICYQMGMFFRNQVAYDMHTGNALLDPETHLLVITDPICGGEREQFIAQITGLKYRDPIEHQMEMLLMDGRTAKQLKEEKLLDAQFAKLRVEPTVNFRANCDRSDDELLHQLAQPVRHRPVMHHFNNPHIDNLPKVNHQIHWNPDMVPMGFNVLEDRVAAHQRQQIRGIQDNREARLAYWVRENGLKPEQVRELGRLAQDWDDRRLQGHREVVFGLMPEHEPIFLKAGDRIPVQPALIKHVRAPREIVQSLRDWWCVEQENRGRVGWGGRFAKAAERIGRFI